MHRVFDLVMTAALMCGIMSFASTLMFAGLALFCAVAAPGFWLDVFTAATIAAIGLFVASFGLCFGFVILSRVLWTKIDPFV